MVATINQIFLMGCKAEESLVFSQRTITVISEVKIYKEFNENMYRF